MTLKAMASDVSHEISVSIQSLGVPVAKAAQMAMKDAAMQLKLLARAHIRQVGFSQRWANAYKVYVYPDKGYSIDAAAFGLFKNLDFSDIYATGGTIHGKPMLWIPFKTTPKIDRRRSAASAKDYQRKGVKMESFKSKSGKPLLGVKVLMTRSQANRRTVKVSLGDILSGARGKRARAAGRAGGGLVRRTVPLFFGVSSVAVKKRFDWPSVEARVNAMVPSLYEKAISKLADE